ncbi:MAG: NADH-ubiquinone oxidoreductase-F iron-sulfur binding region domain-containing protein [Clostridiales bacterium]
MNNTKSIDLANIKSKYNEASSQIIKRIVVCAGTGCVANNSLGVFENFKRIIENRELKVITELDFEENNRDANYISKSGCQGFCQMGPLVTIYPGQILYTKVKPEDVEEIVEKTIVKDEIVDRLLYKEIESGKSCKSNEDIAFYQKQKRYVIKDCGVIDPGSLSEYISNDGYMGAKKSIFEMSDSEICNEILESGLRGRGGGGFPTGKKWDLTRLQNNVKKYVICNGDEGDPGAFMDRSLMEGNPHSVIEGMIIAAMAIGADEGYVYVRAEYPLAVKRMKKACQDLRDMNMLGYNFFNSGKNFDLTIMEGAGAFVCGEETALISSIEGKRGMPNPKPPFPAQSGLFEKPTLINNVETFSTIPLILKNGSQDFKKLGTESSKGTKTFALTGHVVNTGLIEVPFGITLRKIINEIAGGVIDNDGNVSGSDFKAVQIGGPSGGCLTKEHLDLPLDYDSLKKQGAMVGSGGLVVMNNQTCMVKIAHYFMNFTQNESCGKCVLCREGTKQMLSLLEDIIEGRGTMEKLDILLELANNVAIGSLCGLGKTAPNPVKSTVKYFYDEYIAHIVDKKCPAGECTDLLEYKIIEDKCVGCTLCAKKCPVNAIKGEVKKVHEIDNNICIKCGVCMDNCKFKAIKVG